MDTNAPTAETPPNRGRASRPARLGALLALAAALVGLGAFGLGQRGPSVSVRAIVAGQPLRTGDGGLVPVPPPDPLDSPQHRAELDELRKLGAERTKAQEEEAAYWQAGAVLRWNEIARGLVAAHNTNPVVASRLYALLSVAQYDALVAAAAAQAVYDRPPPSEVDGDIRPQFEASVDSTYPSDHAVVAGASAAIIGFVYPARQEVADIDAKARAHRLSRLNAGIARRSDVEVGDRLGRAVAARLIAQAKTDGAKVAGVNWHGEMPEGDDKWMSTESPPTTPVRPLWGKVRPWFLKSGDELRPPPPPAVGTPEFEAGLDEVRQIARTRTAEQTRIALFWADAQGSPTPAGHWNQIAAELLSRDAASELRAARVFAYLNMAVMDAGIACWDAKYHYWLLRPTQADPTISIPVGLPNFPSYPSGHSTFSGAAAVVLSHFFPNDADALGAMAEEASVSRVYGGIHYRFDCSAGLALGREIGRRVSEAEGASAKAP
jgi:membrane-associated phospholipid phosphatase